MKNIFILGAQKCGTTSLANALKRSNEKIELSTPKEPMILSLGDFEQHRSIFCSSTGTFFLSNQEKINKYSTLFNCPDNIKLEASTSYLMSNSAYSLINDTFPDSKVLIVLRDPIKRLTSSYWHYIKSGAITQKFDRAIEFGPSHLINIGFYEENIKSVISTLGKNRVFVISDRHMYKEPELLSKALSSFLDIPIKALKFEKDNTGKYPLIFSLQVFINFLKHASNMNFSHTSTQKGLLSKYGFCGGALHALTKLNLLRPNRPVIKSKLLGPIKELYKLKNPNIDNYIDYGDSKHWYKDHDDFLVHY